MFTQAISRAAQIRGAEIATICDNRQYTWQETADRTARLSAALRRFGIQPGERIGILGANSDRYLEAIHATWWCGAVTVPMNTRWALAEHLYSIDDAGIRLLFVDDTFIEMFRQIALERPALAAAIYMGEGEVPARMMSHDALISATPPELAASRLSSELAGIFYTGGTTGHPKGVMHSFSSLWSGAACLSVEQQPPQHPCYLHAAPMFHLGDLAPAFATTALAGTHVFIPGFSPKAVCEAVREHQVETTLLVPTMIGMLLDSPNFKVEDFASLKLLTFGGSPISDGLLGRMRAAFPQARLMQGFGQTETMATGAILLDDGKSLFEEDKRRRSAGRALFGIELGIFDDKGERVPPGVTGEIWINGPSAMMGYWNKPEQTALNLTDGWVHTGDAGYLDEDGYLYVCDRVKDMIISGGENVYSAEVENAVSAHPLVAQVAVIGVPDERWGERVHAVIVTKEGAAVSLDDIQHHCRSLIAGYKLPRSIELRLESLPLSPVGKVMKTVLRKPHWVGRSRNVN